MSKKLRLAQVGSESMQGLDRLEKAMRTAYARASDCFSRIASEAHLNRFVEDYIGPMVLCGDGRVKPRRLEMTTASDESEAVVNIAIAGGRIRTSDLRVMSVKSLKNVTFGDDWNYG